MQRRWRDRNHPELVLATCRWDFYICWMLMLLLLKRETGSVQPQMRQSVSSLTTLPAACLSNSSWKTCQGRTIEGRIYGDEMTCHPLSPLLREPRRRIRKKRGSVPFRKYLVTKRYFLLIGQTERGPANNNDRVTSPKILIMVGNPNLLLVFREIGQRSVLVGNRNVNFVGNPNVSL